MRHQSAGAGRRPAMRADQLAGLLNDLSQESRLGSVGSGAS